MIGKKGLALWAIILIGVLVLIVIVSIFFRVFGVWWLIDVNSEKENDDYSMPLTCYEDCSFIINPPIEGDMQMVAINNDIDVGEITINAAKGIRQNGNIDSDKCTRMRLIHSAGQASSSCWPTDFKN